jgi:hypothetical protein
MNEMGGWKYVTQAEPCRLRRRKINNEKHGKNDRKNGKDKPFVSFHRHLHIFIAVH